MSEVTPIYQKLAAGEIEQLIRDDLIKELKEYHNEQMNNVLIHPDIYKYLNRKSHKKIKRRLYYDVWYWNKENTRVSKYFESAKKAKNYVNYIHNSDLMKEGDYVRMEKTWCYRQHHPRHKWFYISEEPNRFICVERY
jgi:hypothetical protein